MSSKILADCGGSKIIWCGAINAVTEGFNAVNDHPDKLSQILRELTPQRSDVADVTFFGAGITDALRAERVRQVLAERFPEARLRVESDLAGTALALCGREPGVAAILGTGSNSCVWDGERIVAQTPALGFILGDEGSGAVMGRNFLKYLLKHQFSKEVEQAVVMTAAEAIDHVYRQPDAKKYLGALAPLILSLSRSYDEVRNFAVEQLREFFRFNIAPYRLAAGTVVNFTGGIALHFRPLLEEAARSEGYRVGKVVADPIDQLKSIFIE